MTTPLRRQPRKGRTGPHRPELSRRIEATARLALRALYGTGPTGDDRLDAVARTLREDPASLGALPRYAVAAACRALPTGGRPAPWSAIAAGLDRDWSTIRQGVAGEAWGVSLDKLARQAVARAWESVR